MPQQFRWQWYIFSSFGRGVVDGGVNPTVGFSTDKGARLENAPMCRSGGLIAFNANPVSWCTELMSQKKMCTCHFWLHCTVSKLHGNSYKKKRTKINSTQKFPRRVVFKSRTFLWSYWAAQRKTKEYTKVIKLRRKTTVKNAFKIKPTVVLCPCFTEIVCTDIWNYELAVCCESNMRLISSITFLKKKTTQPTTLCNLAVCIIE